MPVVIGATRLVKKNFKNYLEITILGIPNVREIQSAAIKGTVTILKRVLGFKVK